MAAQVSPGAGVAPASVPAGADSPQPAKSAGARPAVSPRQARAADDAYLSGAKDVQHGDLAAAELKFAQAVKLNPGDNDYVLALAVTREQRVTKLVHRAAQARAAGDHHTSDTLLAEAHQLDPDDRVISQHFDRKAAGEATMDPLRVPAADIASTLSGPIELKPAKELRSIHERGDIQTVVTAVYAAFDIKVSFDASVHAGGAPLRLDLDNVDFATAQRVIRKAAHVFAVPVEPKLALIATDTQKNRDHLEPLIEETLYLPGATNDQMTEYANLARNVFEVKQVTSNGTAGNLLLRGDEDTLKLVNATFADMLDGGSDVLLNVRFYELNKTYTRTVGAQLPTSVGAFSVAAEAQQLVSANQALVDQAIAAGLIKTTGNSFTDLITEVGFLIASGTVSASQYTNLLGIFGGGLSLAGLYLGSTASFNLLLNSSDVRMLDDVQIRAGNRQIANFRAGTRYPIVTATYSSGVGSTLSSALSGLNINGTSVGSLLSQYLGSNTATVPQFQFEDLGLTLNTTPQILRTGDVNLKLELKIEALAGGSIDSIPILNNRSLTSTVTVAPGQTALLVSEVSNSELRSVAGLPGLSELPGFQGTDKDLEKSSGELLITITPHIVRTQAMHVASRRLLAPHAPAADAAF